MSSDGDGLEPARKALDVFSYMLARAIAEQQEIDNLGDGESVVLVGDYVDLNLRDLAKDCYAIRIMEVLSFYASGAGDTGQRARDLLADFEKGHPDYQPAAVASP